MCSPLFWNWFKEDTWVDTVPAHHVTWRMTVDIAPLSESEFFGVTSLGWLICLQCFIYYSLLFVKVRLLLYLMLPANSNILLYWLHYFTPHKLVIVSFSSWVCTWPLCEYHQWNDFFSAASELNQGQLRTRGPIFEIQSKSISWNRPCTRTQFDSDNNVAPSSFLSVWPVTDIFQLNVNVHCSIFQARQGFLGMYDNNWKNKPICSKMKERRRRRKKKSVAAP